MILVVQADFQCSKQEMVILDVGNPFRFKNLSHEVSADSSVTPWIEFSFSIF